MEAPSCCMTRSRMPHDVAEDVETRLTGGEEDRFCGCQFTTEESRGGPKKTAFGGSRPIWEDDDDDVVALGKVSCAWDYVY